MAERRFEYRQSDSQHGSWCLYYTVCVVLYHLSVLVLGFPLELSPPPPLKKGHILLDQEFLTPMAHETLKSHKWTPGEQ